MPTAARHVECHWLCQCFRFAPGRHFPIGPTDALAEPVAAGVSPTPSLPVRRPPSPVPRSPFPVPRPPSPVRRPPSPGVPSGTGCQPGGLWAEMCQIAVQSKNRNSFFFTRWGMSRIPRIVPAGRRRRPIFFADNHLGQDAGLTSVGIDGKTPRWQGVTWSISPVDTWHNVQSQRHKVRLRSNPRAIPGARIAFEAHFSAQGPFFRAIFGTSSFSRAIAATMSLAGGWH
jgi:hypothetical protein